MLLPHGFSLFTGNAGQKNSQKDDLLAIVAENPCFCVGSFTQNTFVGAPVKISKNRLKKNPWISGVLINSGVANVATGKKGEEDAEKCAEIFANSIGKNPENFLVSSTGKIGEFLPMKIFEEHLPLLAKSPKASVENAAKAIMTTDTVPKFISIPCGNGTITAFAKGSGMIAPNMATMLAFVLTDVAVETEKIEKIWKKCVAKTFNAVNVDGCESTSDMALLLTNPVHLVLEEEFEEKILEVCTFLAKKIAADGEGATKLMEAQIVNAENEENAQKFAKAVVASDLLKCAIHGKDLNWGRIFAAIGSTHLPFDPEKLECTINGICVFQNNTPQNISAQISAQIFEPPTIKIVVNINGGNATATAWGCDLSHSYVDINALYRT